MSDFEELLVEFEKYISKKSWKYERYKMGDSYVYDVESTSVVLIEQKEEFSKKHFVVRELLNLKNQKEFIVYSDIKLKPFFARYVKQWVTFYPFDGTLGKEAETVNEKIPELEITKRYENWDGYRVDFLGFMIEEEAKKGYALARYPAYASTDEIRKVAADILGSYAEYVAKGEENEENQITNLTRHFYIMIDKNFREILDKRYINKYEANILKNVKIPDLKSFGVVTYLKNIKEVPYSVFDELNSGKLKIQLFDVYTDNMKSKFPKIEDLKKEYYYLTVIYEDDMFEREYNYISDDETVTQGDRVLVNRAGEDVVALVVEAKHYFGYNVPFPVSATKKIIKKIESEEEMEEENQYLSITTLCNRKEIAENISKTLITKKLAAATHISTVTSQYWWKEKIENEEEFKIEIITRKDKEYEAILTIKSLHDYETPAIFETKIDGLSESTKEWIDESIKQD